MSVTASGDSSHPTPGRPMTHDSRASFWQGVHEGTAVDGVSWWQSVPGLSLDLVDVAGVGPDDGVIDVGAGWSTLVDHLVERGFRDVTAVDLSSSALATVRDRVGPAGAHVVLELGDVLELHRGRTYRLWHDRAVFHFLTEPDEREDYLASLRRHVAPGDLAVVATFGPDGPTHCSGLPIVRYSHDELVAQFPGFRLLHTAGEDHVTPWGTNQQFTAVLLQRSG